MTTLLYVQLRVHLNLKIKNLSQLHSFISVVPPFTAMLQYVALVKTLGSYVKHSKASNAILKILKSGLYVNNIRIDAHNFLTDVFSWLLW